jgi:hypothetical protein
MPKGTNGKSKGKRATTQVNKSKRVMSTSDRYGGKVVQDKKVRGLAGREPFAKPGRIARTKD